MLLDNATARIALANKGQRGRCPIVPIEMSINQNTFLPSAGLAPAALKMMEQITQSPV
jgi:hypothetical protein